MVGVHYDVESVKLQRLGPCAARSVTLDDNEKNVGVAPTGLSDPSTVAGQEGQA